ncbi:MAG TPA: MFS transporter [Thermomicrobiales bacterium]|nr:MFS transporter [Thermomicrobiales bacterium]
MNDPMSATEPTGSATWALAGLALTVLLASLGTSIANIALPTLATAFDASFSATQWVVIAYLLATTSFIVVAGKLGDILGQKRLLLVGLLVFAIGSLICGIAPSLWILILGRTVQGIGASFMLALTLALVGEIVPAERTGSAMGLIGTTSAVGTALGPSLGGFLIGTIGWRSVFLITVPLALLAVGLTFAALPNPRTRSRMTGSTFDLRGAALLFLVLLTYAISMTLGKHSFGLVNAVLLVLAIIGAVGFVALEVRAKAPLIQIASLRDASLRAGLAMNAIVSTVMMATLVIGPFYLTGALGLSPARVGATMSIGPIMVALSSVPVGRFVDRTGADRMILMGLGLALVGALLLTLVPVSFGVAGFIGSVVVLTIGYASFQTANNTATLRGIAADQRGVISGLLNLSRSLGLITGASLMGAIFAAASGALDVKSAQPEQLARGLHTTFAVASVLIGMALAIAFRFYRLSSQPELRPAKAGAI